MRLGIHGLHDKRIGAVNGQQVLGITTPFCGNNNKLEEFTLEIDDNI